MVILLSSTLTFWQGAVFINCNFGRISYRLRDIDVQSSKMTCLSYPSLIWRPHSGNPLEFLDKTYPAKTRGWGYLWRKVHNPNFKRFCMIHPCDVRTDGQTGEWAISYIASMLSRVKNIKCEELWSNLIISVHGPVYAATIQQKNIQNVNCYKKLQW